ncbi:MAG: hypothetical protein ACRDRH_29320 [Pseudonocardia sp.]
MEHRKSSEEIDFFTEVPQAVRPADVRALVAAYVRAQEAERVVRGLLVREGVPADAATPVATLDTRGRLTIGVVLHCATEEPRVFRIIAAIRLSPESRPTDAA